MEPMRRRGGTAWCLALFGALLLAPPARAVEPELAPITRVSGLEALNPLDARDLGGQRAGRLPALLPRAPSPAPTIRLWDEIGRPARPQAPASQGVVTSTHRGYR
jgi:hypothetical protein